MTLLTAEEFAEQRLKLPEAGRWTELEAGCVVQTMPPEDRQGAVILNLSKAIANWVTAHAAMHGVPHFGHGVVTKRQPDTVRVPGMMLVQDDNPFAVADEFLSERIPVLVAEVLSGRETEMEVSARIEEYLQSGVKRLWLFAPLSDEMFVCDASSQRKLFGNDVLSDRSLMSGFHVPVAQLLNAPEW